MVESRAEVRREPPASYRLVLVLDVLNALPHFGFRGLAIPDQHQDSGRKVHFRIPQQRQNARAVLPEIVAGEKCLLP